MSHFPLQTRRHKAKRSGFTGETESEGRKQGCVQRIATPSTHHCDLTGLPSRAGELPKPFFHFHQNLPPMFLLNRKTQWHFEDKMSRCIFICTRTWTTAHLFCKQQQTVAVHTQVVSQSSEAERSNSPKIGGVPLFIFSQKTSEQIGVPDMQNHHQDEVNPLSSCLTGCRAP